MTKFHIAALSAAFIGLLAPAAFAEAPAQTGAMASPMAKDAMVKDGMAMSKSDMKTAEACKKMSAEAMAKSSKCQTLAKAHPDAMGMMATGAMSTGAMSSGAMSKPAH
jgi:hypothetical protein